MTLRLSAFFEEQIRTIISEYKTAVKSSDRLRRSQRFRKKMQQQDQPSSRSAPDTGCTLAETQQMLLYIVHLRCLYLVVRMFRRRGRYWLTCKHLISSAQSKENRSQNSGKSGADVGDQIYLSQSVCSAKSQEASGQRSQLLGGRLQSCFIISR